MSKNIDSVDRTVYPYAVSVPSLDIPGAPEYIHFDNKAQAALMAHLLENNGHDDLAVKRYVALAGGDLPEGDNGWREVTYFNGVDDPAEARFAKAEAEREQRFLSGEGASPSTEQADDVVGNVGGVDGTDLFADGSERPAKSEPIVVTYDVLLAALREAVAEKGEDYVYKKRGAAGNRCVYVHEEDGKKVPSCIIGNAMHRLGVPLGNLHFLGGSEALFNILVKGGVIADVEPKARDLAMGVQAGQDYGVPWGAALIQAVEMTERSYPA